MGATNTQELVPYSRVHEKLIQHLCENFDLDFAVADVPDDELPPLPEYGADLVWELLEDAAGWVTSPTVLRAIFHAGPRFFIDEYLAENPKTPADVLWGMYSSWRGRDGNTSVLPKVAERDDVPRDLLIDLVNNGLWETRMSGLLNPKLSWTQFDRNSRELLADPFDPDDEGYELFEMVRDERGRRLAKRAAERAETNPIDVLGAT
ncbi:hypothetical protein FQ330_03080 [Agrococcus sediminis]|uniref:Uncharacterized protein n=1 Tax=Agrococcus sediminis TaxID=2599924 RepID=A0A5M8QQE0_9MICO|nr:hypothetical protein [Agrococcus sediminis]KAA6436402.1 hypothetical protein FQ330_03080 [Agrococcus sediminis]